MIMMNKLEIRMVLIEFYDHMKRIFDYEFNILYPHGS